MTFSNINVGTNPNDGLGDKLRDAFIIVNDNFANIVDFDPAVLNDYTTKTYVDDADGNLQTQITSLGYLIDLGEGSIQALQTQVYNLGLLVDGKASLTQLNNATAAINLTISNLQTVVENKIDEAPLDGKSYVRRNGSWIETTGGLPYKTYSAIVNQNGVNDYFEVDNTSGDLEVGRTYRIVDNDSGTSDFTNIGAIANTNGLFFMATGTTPTSWGNDNKGRLSSYIGIPLFNVLENTIGHITWLYDGDGFYIGQVNDINGNPQPVFTRDKVPTVNYRIDPSTNDHTLSVIRLSDEYISMQQFNSSFEYRNGIGNGYIEIRVYN